MLLEVAAVTAYQENHTRPTILSLVGDDANDFYNITSIRVLCWIIQENNTKSKLHFFLGTRNWSMILDHASGNIIKSLQNTENPTEAEKIWLSNLFDEKFSIETVYDGLYNRIGKTKKKEEAKSWV